MSEECPQAVADLVAQCMDPDPAVRPSAKEVVVLLSQPDAVLERHLPGRRPKPADAQVKIVDVMQQTCHEWASRTSNICIM